MPSKINHEFVLTFKEAKLRAIQLNLKAHDWWYAINNSDVLVMTRKAISHNKFLFIQSDIDKEFVAKRIAEIEKENSREAK